MDSRRDEEIERYIDRVAFYLPGADTHAIDDTLEEIRQHLTARSKELTHCGYPADQAAQAAIRRFGSPDQVGHSLARQLLSYRFQIKVYCAFMICQYLKLMVVPLFNLHLVESLGAFVFKFFIFSAITTTAILLVPLAFMLASMRSKKRVRQRGRVLKIQQDLQTMSKSMPNPTGFRRYFYLFFVLLVGSGFLTLHQYGQAALVFLEAIEFTFIRTSVKRIVESASAS